jgi:hypothetical protein
MDDLLEDRQRPCAMDGGAPGLVATESELEILSDFLRTRDFRQLRADHPPLAGGRPLTVELHRAPNGDVAMTFLK